MSFKGNEYLVFVIRWTKIKRKFKVNMRIVAFFMKKDI